MDDPKIKTKVVHSESKQAWNVVGTTLGAKYKIARVPYQTLAEGKEAMHHADFISYCFNNSSKILKQK